VSAMGFIISAKFWKYVFGAVLCVIALIGVAGVLYVNQAGGLARLIERQLNSVSDKLVVNIAAARLGVELSSRPLILTTSDVYITVGESTINLPAAELEFGLSSLLTGQPEKLVLRGVELDLVKTATGWRGSKLFGIAGALAEANALHPAASAHANPATTPAVPPFQGLRKIGIDAERVTLSDASGVLPPVAFSDIYVDLDALAAGALSGTVRGRQISDGLNTDAGTFTGTFTSWSGGGRLAVDVTAQNFELDDVMAYSDVVPPAIRHLGTLSGHVGVTVDAAKITYLEADVSLQNGRLEMPDLATKTAFTSLDLIATYAHGQNALNVTKSDIKLADGRVFKFIGAINDMQAETPTLAGVIKADNLSIKAMLADWPDAVAADYKAAIQSRLSSGYLHNITAQIVGQLDVAGRSLTLSKFGFNGDFSGVRVNLSHGNYRRIVGTVDGSAAVDMGSHGQIDNLTIDATVTDGSLLLAGYGDAVMVPTAHMKTNFAKGQANLETATIDFGHKGKLTLSGAAQLTDQQTVEAAQLTITSADIDAALMTALWPESAAPNTRIWTREHVPSGRIREAKLTLNTLYDADQDSQILDSIEGSLKLQNTALRWSDKTPPFSNISADLLIDNDSFIANVTNAHIGDMNVQHGKVIIAPIIGDGQRAARLSIALKGALGKAVELAKSSGLKAVAGVNVADIIASGEAELLMQAEFPLAKQIDTIAAVQKLDATISNGSFTNLPGGVHLKNAELVVAFGKDRADVSGTAAIMGAPGEFSVQFDRDKSQVTAVGLASPSPELAAILAAASGLEIAGQLGGKLVYKGDLANKTAALQIAAPLGGTSLDVPSLNWAKLPAEDGQAIMTIVFRNGEVTAISDIDVVAGSLVAKGQVAFDTAGNVQAGFFERVAWPGNDIRDLIFESNSDKSWKVGANAKIIDLVPLRRNKGVSGGETINFDFTADQIIVDNQISLSGHLVGTRSKLGAGTAEFSGSMLVRGKPLITEAQFGIQFGAGDETISGAGLIGGGETDFRFVDKMDDDPKLTLTSKNGGRMLSGLDITNTVLGGDITLETVFSSEDYKSYDTRIDIKDFSVVEAPRAVRALSVLSLAGLYSLVEGDGTAFKVGEAKLETRGAVVNIKSLKASGDAVGFSLLGVYDRATKQVDVSGNLVPASQISEIIGKVPLIGGVFTGLDKSGIFTTQFRITGRSDDMQTSVNAASIAPGLLRDIFSPNWLSNEGARLFDDNQNGTAAPAP